MKICREEKSVARLNKLSRDLKAVRKELHTCKQKNRDLEKSRAMYKARLRSQEQLTERLIEDLKKKLQQSAFRTGYPPSQVLRRSGQFLRFISLRLRFGSSQRSESN